MFVLVVTPPGGKWPIHKHDPGGGSTPEGGVLISQIRTEGAIIDLFSFARLQIDSMGVRGLHLDKVQAWKR